MEKELEQQPANCIRVVLFGPESTGKTTLSTALAKHYNTSQIQLMQLILVKVLLTITRVILFLFTNMFFQQVLTSTHFLSKD